MAGAAGEAGRQTRPLGAAMDGGENEEKARPSPMTAVLLLASSLSIAIYVTMSCWLGKR